jgi:hypothetical protein
MTKCHTAFACCVLYAIMRNDWLSCSRSLTIRRMVQDDPSDRAGEREWPRSPVAREGATTKRSQSSSFLHGTSVRRPQL